MDTRAVRIFLACLLGSGIGSLVALHINAMFWWIGAFTGGLVGYIGYDIGSVARAIPVAATVAARKVSFIVRLFIASTVLTAALLSVAAVPILVWDAIERLSVPQIGLSDVILFVVIPSAVAMLYTLMSLDFALGEERLEHGRSGAWEFARSVNAYTVYCRYLPRALKWLAQRTPHALKVSTAFIVAVCVELRAFTISFLKQLFLLIHSEMRLLCLFDAALGSVIGYFAGNVLIGAIAGGVLGVLNFEILSRRILRLVP